MEACRRNVLCFRIVKEQLIEFGAEADKIHVITSKADTDKFNPDIYASDLKEKLNINDEYIIGFSGTFAKWHGIELLAKSIKKITQEIPNSKILLVGDGELRGNVDRIIEESGVQDDVIITGLVKYEEVPRYLSLCNLLVSPCVPNDNGEFINSPVKLFEYLSMGKPIVASEIGQQGEVINDRTNGLLCKVNDIDDFVAKIKILHDDHQLSDQISKRARTEAIKKYDWINNAETILSVYNELAPNFEL